MVQRKKMAHLFRFSSYLFLLVLILYFSNVESYLEPGKWFYEIDKNSYPMNITKSLYANSTLSVKVTCDKINSIEVNVMLTLAKCMRPDLQIGDDDLSDTKISLQSKVICADHPSTVEVPPAKSFDKDGIYILVVDVSKTNSNFTGSVIIEMKGTHGYLSAMDWPLLPFYAVMCVVYSVYALFWLVLCFCYWRELLRIQYWIGAVIFLGMLEKATFVGEYDSIRKTGISTQTAIIVAELVSSLKRALARMLVIIVCLGFGIIKPRLGSALHKVTAVGFIYFVFSCLEGITRVVKHKADSSLTTLLCILPLVVTDAVICMWIFSSIVKTIRLLYLRKNVIKLGLYRHFRNTLLFGVLFSLVYMIWSFKAHKWVKCIDDWKQLWWDEAFWHLLFSLLLLVIMILWRPSANNQRYSYSPLQDVDEFAEEDYANEAVGDIKKKRGMKKSSNSSYREKNSNGNDDEDLKWVDENIPTSVLDITLPGLLDSDEEINRNKVEISKMQ